MADSAREVIAITTGRPVDPYAQPTPTIDAAPMTDPVRMTCEQVADLLEQAAATSLDVAVRRLDELLDQLRPAAEIRHLLASVSPSTMREAVALVSHRRGRPTQERP